MDWNWPLTLDGVAGNREFIGQSRLIYRLKETRTEVTMNLNGGADDRLWDLCASVVQSKIRMLAAPLVRALVGVRDREEICFLEGLANEL